MREFITILQEWVQQSKQAALATVVNVAGSSPRPLGAKMIVSPESEMHGSVSGGCVETSVLERALNCMESGKPELLHFGIPEEVPWSVGLACGGEIDVLMEPLFHPNCPHGLNLELFNHMVDFIKREQPFVLASVISQARLAEKELFDSGGKQIQIAKTGWGYLLNPSAIISVVEHGQCQQMTIKTSDNSQITVFLEPVLPLPRLVIVGAVHIAASLVNYARELGYKTIVIDPRSTFLTPQRFPHADELIPAWPQDCLSQWNIRKEDCVVVISHDEKIDLPALQYALTTTSSYIGLLGSLKTREERFDALREMGITESQLARIHAPIGLNIKAKTPEEIAISIMAEIIACRRS
jgi:xanthine dehydrogenase accessory factor